MVMAVRCALRGGGQESVAAPPPLHPFPVEACLVAAAEDLERAGGPGGVRADEDPVLPGGEPSEDARLDGFGHAETQVCFESRQCVGRKARALLEGNADLV